MENINVGKNIDRSYYLLKEEDFSSLRQIINCMPAYQIGETREYTFTDTYFETNEYFLKGINASIRVRKTPLKQTLSIVCNTLGETREFEMEMNYGESIQDKDEYILFLEDKIQSIYTHQIQVDVVRILHYLKPFLVMTTTRKVHDIVTGTEFRMEVDFDRTKIETKRNKDEIFVVEMKNKCFLTQTNEQMFERFVKEVERRLVMIPMGETKLAAGLRVVNREW